MFRKPQMCSLLSLPGCSSSIRAHGQQAQPGRAARVSSSGGKASPSPSRKNKCSRPRARSAPSGLSSVNFQRTIRPATSCSPIPAEFCSSWRSASGLPAPIFRLCATSPACCFGRPARRAKGPGHAAEQFYRHTEKDQKRHRADATHSRHQKTHQEDGPEGLSLEWLSPTAGRGGQTTTTRKEPQLCCSHGNR